MTSAATVRSRCRHCGQEREIPCRSTRDMEILAIEGDPACRAALADLGGGERGLERVDRLRQKAATSAAR
jgi:hypothetical protein